MDNKVAAQVAKHFDKFYYSEVFSDIIDHFSSVCEILQIQPTNFSNFYETLKGSVKSCQGKNLFKILDERVKQPIFCDNNVASNIKMVVIGAGPIGLRTAIEAQLMGARVTVMEKRKSFTRNNVLHLWPWVIEDLKSLGAKSFYPRFCTGTMNHISIRRLQCILLKTALCFGVEVHGGVEFKGVSEPDFEGDPWRLEVTPSEHPLANTNMDIIIGAEGKRVTLPGFRRKEFRGKLAIAITANFVNKRTTAEAVVEEISGVAFVYKQDFFNTLYEELGIALENVVYYKDETHYFVMTTKKHSLLDRKVLKKDLKDPIKLLSPNNVNKEMLYSYIRDACDYCTDYQLPSMEFALNHYEQPDVALFDFTSMFASANASHVIERKNSQLLFGLVGDGLLEPFWPTGTGIARGFLGAFDCCWMVKQWASGDLTPSEVMAERESILKLLPQTTHENLTKDYKNVSIIPKTRYPNMNDKLYAPFQVEHLYDSDVPENKDIPRYRHKMYKEISATSQFNLKKKMSQLQSKRPVNSSMRFQDERRETAPTRVQQEEPRIKPSDLYQRMKNQQNKEIEPESSNNTPPNRRNSREAGVPTPKTNQKTGVSTQKTGILPPNLTRKEKMKTILNDEESKAEFVKKMSKTFGYGLPSNVQEKPDTLAQEAEKCALLVKSSNIKQNSISKGRKKRSSGAESGNEVKKSSETKKKLGSSTSRDREIQQYNFDSAESCLHSSVAPIIPTLDIQIDPELDFMLAELEQDQDFSNLSENDQKTWLESLFFQDTLHLPGRANITREQLNKTKQQQKPVLRVNNALSGNIMQGPPKNRNSNTITEKTSLGERPSSSDLPDVGRGDVKRLSSSSQPPIDTNKYSNNYLDNKNLNTSNKNMNMPNRNVNLPNKNEKNSIIAQPTKVNQIAAKKATSKDIELDDIDLDDINLDDLDLEDLDLDLENDKKSAYSSSLSSKSSGSSYSTPPMQRPTQKQETTSAKVNESVDEITGVNKNLCSLAQQYFSGPSKKPSVTRKPSIKENQDSVGLVDARKSVEEEEEDKAQKEKESLVASFFGGGGGAAGGKKPAHKSTKVNERASFAPSAGAGKSGGGSPGVKEKQQDQEDEERKELENLEKIMEGGRTKTPSPPPRTLDKHALMLRMMSNVNSIMNGSRKLKN